MPEPTIPTAGESAYDEIKVSQPGDEQRSWPLKILIGGLFHPMRVLHDLVSDSDGGPGWSALVDPQRTPSPRFTGQLNGVRVTEGASDAQQRGEIENAAGLLRGGPDEMAGAMKLTLDDPETGIVTIYERVSTAYRMIAVSYDSQTSNPAATEVAARSQKPAGLLLEYRNDRGWSVGHLEAAYPLPDDLADVEAAFATIDDLETELPSA